MYRRRRNVHRPQPPSTPRYIAVSLAGVFAIVPVSEAIGAGSRDGGGQGARSAADNRPRLSAGGVVRGDAAPAA